MAVLPYISLATTGSATPQQIPVFPTLPQGWSITKTPSWPGRSLRSVSGLEWRATDQTGPRYEWELTYPILRDGSYAKNTGGTGDGFDEFHDLAGFFDLFSGGYSTFLYDDPTDNKVVGQFIGIGDGTTISFQLKRTVGTLLPGGGWTDVISAINVVSNVYNNGSPYSIFSVNHLTGQVVLPTVPTAGAIITADFTYFWYVRFTQDSMNFENFMLQLWQNKAVKFISVLPLPLPAPLPPTPNTVIDYSQFALRPVENVLNPFSPPYTSLSQSIALDGPGNLSGSQILIASVVNTNTLATVVSVESTPVLDWQLRSTLSGSGAVMEIWWADPRKLPYSTVVKVTMNFAAATTKAVLGLLTVVGPVVYKAGSPWDVNSSLPVKTISTANIISSTFSTSSTNSFPLAWVGSPDALVDASVAGDDTTTPPTQSTTFMGQAGGNANASLTTLSAVPWGGLSGRPEPPPYVGGVLRLASVLGGSTNVNPGNFPWLMITDSLGGS